MFKLAFRSNSDSILYSISPTLASKFDTECEVHRFIQTHRRVPNYTIKWKSSKLLFGRTSQTTLDIFRPQVQRQVFG